jgi:signal transduction histidine kinase
LKSPTNERRFRPVIDTVVALVTASTPFFYLYVDELSDPSGPPLTFATAGAIALLIGLPLLVRRRYPFAVLALLLVASVGAAIAGGEERAIPLLIGTAVALFTVATIEARRAAVAAGMVSALVAFVVEVATESGSLTSLDSLDSVLWTACAVAAGDAVRSRRISMQVLEERAERAEATREQEARTRVANERLHIARELHDIVAHHIAVVNIQAGLAERAMSRDAHQTAATAITHVSEAARLALDDLSALLRLLRTPGDVDDRAPAPGLAQITQLLATYARSDDHVQVTTRGEVRPLDAASELTAYRVIQESLTNASKHGIPGQTRLTLSFEPADLVMTVTNPVRGDHQGQQPEGPGTGYGMIGLRERVDAIGGRVKAGRQADGTFMVEAHIPYALATPARSEVTS